jgi:hypothetical protein
MDCFVASLLAMTKERPQLNANAANIPASVSMSPTTSIGTRLLPEYGSA